MMTIQDKIENLQEPIAKRRALVKALHSYLNPDRNEALQHVNLLIRQGVGSPNQLPLEWHEIAEMLRLKIRAIDSVCADIIKKSEKSTDELSYKDMDEYQLAASEFYNMDPTDNILHFALGLNEEAGEVAGKLNKAWRDGDKDLDDFKRIEAIGFDLGDCLWYIAALAESIGYKLSQVANMNIDKLTGRLSRGTIGGDGDDR